MLLFLGWEEKQHIYCPGSHVEKMYEGFTNYPQTNLKTCDKATWKGYDEYMNSISTKYKTEKFIARKGDVLLWHGMLAHGGGTVKNQSLTRKSFVVHYIVDGVNKETEVDGPFNWYP